MAWEGLRMSEIFSFDRQAAGSIFRHCLFSNPSELLLTQKAMVILASFGVVALVACPRLVAQCPREGQVVLGKKFFSSKF